MQRVQQAVTVAACLALLLRTVVADFSGDGTFYGDNGYAGYCQGNVLAQGGQWPPNGGSWTGLKVALNQAQILNGKAWGNTEMCGKMLMVRGTGGGLGMTPISKSWQLAMVTNMCPECQYGSLDFGTSGDGRWNIQWHWGTDGSGANHVDSVASNRAIIPVKKAPAPTRRPTRKRCDRKCQLARAVVIMRNRRAALLKQRAAKLAARQLAKRRAAAAKYNARLRAALLALRAQKGRKLLASLPGSA